MRYYEKMALLTKKAAYYPGKNNSLFNAAKFSNIGNHGCRILNFYVGHRFNIALARY